MAASSPSETTFAGPQSALELWHASGAPQRQMLLGRWSGIQKSPADPIDIAILAPCAREISRVWLERSIADAAGRLDGDGLVWVIVAPRWRRVAERAVRRSGLMLLDAVLAIPPWPHTAHLMPLSPAALRDAGPRHHGISRRGARAIAWLLGSRILAHIVRRVAPGCALLAAPSPAGSRVFGWLGEPDGRAVRTVTVSTSSRRDARTAVAMRFDDAGTPDLVVKTALDEGGLQRLGHEREALEHLGPAAAAAGARVPVPRASPYPWRLASCLIPGSSAGALIRTSPARLEVIALRVADWLLAWNVATAVDDMAPGDLLAEVVSRPVVELETAGIAHHSYAAAVSDLVRKVVARPLVCVAAHNDLTMANVLLDGSVLGILDWESATACGLPLTDLWYMLADAVARARGVVHASAVEALVCGGPKVPQTLLRLAGRHAAQLHQSSEQRVLSFHACWIGHAHDELRRGVTDGPFTQVVRAVAARRLLWPAAP